MYTIFDTETTGFPLKTKPEIHSDQPYIMQLGAQILDADFNLINEFNYLVKLPHGVEAHPEAMAVTGITADMCRANGAHPKQVHCTFSNFLQRSKHVIAHNLAFDSKLWSIFCARHRLPNLLVGKQSTCTMEILTPKMRLRGKQPGRFKWPTLTEAYRFVTNGQQFDGAHDALADVRAVTTIWKYLNGV